MRTLQALDIMESLFRAAEHPDITDIVRYGRDTEPGGQSPSGIRLMHRNGTAALVCADAPHPGARPLPLGEMPPIGLRAQRILVLAHQLLDVAQPQPFAQWELCATPGTGDWESGDPPLSALRITCRDRSVIYLRGMAASGSNREPAQDPFPDYQIPEGVRSWQADAVGVAQS